MQLENLPIDINIDKISCPILECQLFLYILGFLYLIKLFAEHFKYNLCYFLSTSKFGFKNIYIALFIFLSPILEIKGVALLYSLLGVDEVAVKSSEIGLVILEFILVTIEAYIYMFIGAFFVVVLLLVFSISGMFFSAIFGSMGALIGLAITIYLYKDAFNEILNRTLSFPFEIIKCFHKIITGNQ